jgi:putative ABC transport system permease protein
MLLPDLRHALRLFFANTTFTVIAVGTLALGIGATTAIFSVVDAVLLRPSPLPAMDRLAVVWETDRQSGTTREPGSFPDFLDYRERASSVAFLSAFLPSEVTYTPERAEPQRVQTVSVSADFFEAIGIQPALGREFAADDARPGGSAVAVVSDAFARQLSATPVEAVGRTLRLDGRPCTVVGVLPAGADFGVFQILRSAAYSRSFSERSGHAGVDVWLPLQATAASLPRSTHPLFMVGRLRQDAAIAQRELDGVAGELERAHRENAARGVFVERLSAVVLSPVRPPLLLLLAAVGLVLLVACANVANLLLARGTARRREVAVRLAIGATRRQLARQFATEGLILTLAAGVLGVAIAAYGVKVLVALAPANLPRIADAAVNLRVLLVTLTVAVVAGLAFGLVPTLQARRIDLQEALKTDGAHARVRGAERIRLRSVLVVSEFALAVMLVIGAALLIQSFWRVQRVNPGFDAHGVLKAEYQLPPDRYPVDFKRFPNFVEMHGFTHGLLAGVSSMPGVRAAAVAGNHPIDPGFTNSFQVVGREAESRTFPEVSVRRVSAGYFETMGVPLVNGRLLQDSDSTTSAPVLLVNEAAAKRFFAYQAPVGQQIRFWGAARTVVGVVGNERFHGLVESAPPAVYTPLDQTPSIDGSGVLLVKADAEPSALAATIRGAIQRQDPGLAIYGLEPLDDTIARSVAERRFTMLVLGLLAAVALVLAAAGIHGVLSYAVGQRTREIGIRVALGANPGRLRRLVIGEGMRLALTGAALGVLGALALSRLLTSLLFGVTATDTPTFVAVPLLLCLVAVIAGYVPARRATRVDPLEAMRN